MAKSKPQSKRYAKAAEFLVPDKSSSAALTGQVVLVH
jgi:hypothetical protein